MHCIVYAIHTNIDHVSARVHLCAHMLTIIISDERPICAKKVHPRPNSCTANTLVFIRLQPTTTLSAI